MSSSPSSRGGKKLTRRKEQLPDPDSSDSAPDTLKSERKTVKPSGKQKTILSDSPSDSSGQGT